jgi:hypothetical protein
MIFLNENEPSSWRIAASDREVGGGLWCIATSYAPSLKDDNKNGNKPKTTR